MAINPERAKGILSSILKHENQDLRAVQAGDQHSGDLDDVIQDMFGAPASLLSSTETISPGSLIINMGAEPQTIANGLKPYGLIFDLIKNHGVSVKWVINPSKSSNKNTGFDDIDFSYNGIDFKSGAFVIPSVFRSAEVNAAINNWISQGVVAITTTSALDLPVFTTLTNAPNWTLDAANGSKVIAGLSSAGIPEFNDELEMDPNYRFKPPDQLDCCDYLYVMPHADPEWATHSNLYTWTQAKPTGCRGWVWSACHAVSALENSFDYITPDPTRQMNFLVDTAFTADPNNDPWGENSAVLWGDHDDGDGDYVYDNAYVTDPFMQFMGKLDGAQESGSESLYMPYASTDWRSSTSVAIYDDPHPDTEPGGIAEGNKPAKLVYGPAFGVGTKSDYSTGNGWVMYEAQHSIGGNEPEFVAAYRAFFNFSFMAALERGADVEYVMMPPDSIIQGTSIDLSAIATNSQPQYTFEWSISPNVGSFSSNPQMTMESDTAKTVYTSPTNTSTVNAIISLSVRDNCSIVKRINANVVLKPTPPSPPTCSNSIVSIAPNASTEIDLTTLATDINGDLQPSGFSITTNPTVGSVAINASAIAKYIPKFNYVGLDSFRFSATDNAGNTCIGKVTVNISCPTGPSTNQIWGTVYYDGSEDGISNELDYGYPLGATIRLYQDNGTKGKYEPGTDVELTTISPDISDSSGVFNFNINNFYSITLKDSITADANTANEKSNNDIKIDQSDFDLNNTDHSYAAFRFTDLNIPQGANITNAYMSLYNKDNETSTSSSFQIVAMDTADAPAILQTTSYLSNVYNDSSTVSSVPWNISGDLSADTRYHSPDLSSIVQEIVSKPGWSSGNAITFVIDNDPAGNDDIKFHYSNAGVPKQPHLIVAYSIDTLHYLVRLDTASVPANIDTTSKTVLSTFFTGHGQSTCAMDFGLTEPNNPPEALDITFGPIISCADTTMIDTFLVSDPDLEQSVDSFTITALPSPSGKLFVNGTTEIATAPFGLSVQDMKSLRFLPAPGYTGEVIFTYTATDNDPDPATSLNATYTIVVNNCPPITLDDTNAPLSSSSGNTLLSELLSGTDSDGAVVSFEINSLPPSNTGLLLFNGVPLGVGQVIDTADVDLLSFTPNGSFIGNASFTFSAIDDDASKDLSPATYTIPIANTAPKAVNVQNPTHILDTGEVRLITPLLGTDVDGVVEKFVIASLPASGLLIVGMDTLAVNDTLTASQAAMIKYDPESGYSGTVMFTYNSIDDLGAVSAASGIYSIMVTRAPEAQDVINDIILYNDPPTPIDSLIATDDDSIASYLFCEIPDESLGIIYFLRNETDTMFLIARDYLTRDEMKTMWFEPAGNQPSDIMLNYAVEDNCGFIAKAEYVIPFKKFEISLAKSLSGHPVKDKTTGFFKTTFKYKLKNEGSEDLDSLSLTDDFASQFGAAFKGLSTMPPNIMLNGPTGTGGPDTSFTGTGSNTELLDRSGKLLPGDTLSVTVEVLIDPSSGKVPLKNQAVASGLPVDDMGNPFKDAKGNEYGFVMDVSDSGKNPSGVNDGELGAQMGSTSDSTVLYLPDVSVTKGIADGKLLSSGNIEVRFDFEVLNTGNTWLTNLSLVDSLHFMPVSPSITVSNVDATSPPLKNTNYDGIGNNDLLAGSAADTLKNGESFRVELVVQVTPENLMSIAPAFNMAMVRGDIIDSSGPITGFSSISDLSDDVTGSAAGGDPASTNSDGLGDQGTFDDPTPLTVPIVGASKHVSRIEDASSGINGNADVTFKVTLKNLGSDTLYNISAMDSMFSQMGGTGGGFVRVVTGPSVLSMESASSQLPTVNKSYGPDVHANLLSGTDGIMAPGDSVTISVEVELDPNASNAPIPLNNQVVASGKNSYGTVVSVHSDSGSDPSTSNPGAPGDSGGIEDPTPVSISRIGLAKQLLATNFKGDNYEVTFRLTLQNIGNDTLTCVTLVEDLNDEFGAAFVDFDSTTLTVDTSGVTGIPPVLNTSYDGGQAVSDSIYNFASGGVLAPNDVIKIDLSVVINPNASGLELPGDLINQAEAAAKDSDNTSVRDLSDSGSDPDGNNEGESGDTGTKDDPTPLPAIGVAKETGKIAGPYSSGHYDVTFNLNVKNTGTDTLDLTGLTDDLAYQLGDAFQSVVSVSTPVTNSLTTPMPVINPDYDGGVTNDSLFAFSQNTRLAPLDTIAFAMVIRINPAKTDTVLHNQAKAFGLGQSGFLIQDFSDSGMSPSGSNENAPGDTGGSGDPSPIVISSIGLAKTITNVDDTPSSGAIGNYNITFQLSIENTGTVNLSNPSLVEDLESQLGGAFVKVVAGPSITFSNAAQSPMVNNAYNGIAPNDSIFNNTSNGLLNPSDSMVIELTIEIDPNKGPQPLANQASIHMTAVDALNHPLKDEHGNEIFAVDLSDSGSDTRSANSTDDDDMGTKDDPTRIVLPQLASTKAILDTEFIAAGSHRALTFEIMAVNTGSDTVKNLVVRDDVAAQFGTVFVSADGSDITLIKEKVQLSGSVSSTYNGMSNDTLYSGATLAPNDSVVIRFVVEVDPDASGGPDPLLNSATVEGMGTQSGETTVDSTDAATPQNPSVEGSNPDGPGNSGGINDPLNINIPVGAINDTVTTASNVPVDIAVIDNDIEGLTGFDPGSIDTIAGAGPANGTVSIDPSSGEMTYTPGEYYAGSDQFDYVVCDSISPNPNCDTATVFITVKSEPVVAVNNTDTTLANTPVAIHVLDNDTIGLVGLNFSTLDTIAGQGPQNGTVVINMNGTVTYTPAINFTGIDSFAYVICDSIQPTPNCDTAVATVLIPLTPIDAVDDNFTSRPFNGLDGGRTGYILANDSLGPAAVDSADITLTAVIAGTTDTGQVYLDLSDGTVIIEPNTAAGTYHVEYSICENLNPVNCDTAHVIVTVDPAPIDAIDNDFTSMPFNGLDGGSTTSILTNDSLNHAPLDPDEVTLTPVYAGTTDTSQVYLNPSTGIVVVDPNTPAGDYDVKYSICEILNPANCDTATVTVTVEAAPIDAVDDDFTSIPVNGLDGGRTPSILGNDSLNHFAVDTKDITLTSVYTGTTDSSQVYLDPAKGTVVIDPNTPAGDYDVVYSICEKLNPTNCDTATVTVTVEAAPIDAVDDDFTLIPVNGLDGGRTPSILGNDSLNHFAVDTKDITLTPVYTGTTDSSQVYLDPATGTVVIDPNTPAGDYDVVYSICEKLNPTNCDTATVMVTVVPAAIDAVDDDYTAHAFDGLGGAVTPFILANDSLNSQVVDSADITLTPVLSGTTDSMKVYLDPLSGTVVIAPGTPSGNYDVVYSICEKLNPANCDTATVSLTVAVPIVALTKSIVSIDYPSATGNHSHTDVTFELIIQSTGTDTLHTVQLKDDFKHQLGPEFVQVIQSETQIISQQSQISAAINPYFDGDANDSLFIESPLLAQGDSVVVRITAAIDPNAIAMSRPLLNQASASAIGNIAKTVIGDLSDAATPGHADPSGTNPDGPGDTGGKDDPLEIWVPMLGMTKQLVGIDNPSDSGLEDHIDVTYEFHVKNTGNDTLDLVQIVDDLDGQIGDAFVSITGVPVVVDQHSLVAPVINTDYDGANNDSLFAARAVLAPNDFIKVRVTAVLEPLVTASSLEFSNQALAVGQGRHADSPVGDPHADVDLYNVSSGYVPSLRYNAADVSDSGDRTESSNPDSPDDKLSEDDPTIGHIPMAGLAKDVVDVRASSSNEVGNFDITYEFVYRNTGNTDLTNIQIEDDLRAQLTDAFVRVVDPAEYDHLATNPQIISSGADTDPLVNTKYTGEAPFTGLFIDKTGLLKPDSQIVVHLVVEINPNANVMVDTLFNQAIATANGANDDGFPAYDMSDYGDDPEGNNNDIGGRGTKKDPTPLNLSDMNVAKAVVGIGAATSGSPGNANVEFEFRIKNKGNEDVTQIGLTDDLAAQLGDAFVQLPSSTDIGVHNPRIVASSAHVTPTLNASYDGTFSNDQIFNEDGVLRPNDTLVVRLVVEVDPNALDENRDGVPDALFNQARITGRDPRGGIVSDLSDSGIDPESNNPDAPNDSGMMDDPTPVEIPVINVAKTVTSYDPPASGTSGNLDVTFELNISNTGNVTMVDLQLADTMDLAEHFGLAYVGLSDGSSVRITASTSTTDPGINAGFDGFATGDANIFDGVSGELKPGEHIIIEIKVEIDPAAVDDSTELYNQATSYGLGISQYPKQNGPGGLPATREIGVYSDGSDSGMDPESDNDDDSQDTPTLIIPCIYDPSVACVGEVNLSLDANCVSQVTPSLVNAGIPKVCETLYILHLFDEYGEPLGSNKIHPGMAGTTIKYQLRFFDSDIVCWGYIHLEDKTPPVLHCVDDTVSCIDLIHFTGPEVIGECKPVEFIEIDEGFEEICGDPLVKKVFTRTYIAIDQAGNRSEPCTQRIYLERVDFASKVMSGMVKIPGDVTLDCGTPGLYDEDGHVSVLLSGVPTWHGVSLLDQSSWDICKIGVTYDDLLLIDTDCEKKYVRTWKLYEWVCGEEPDPVTATQFIRITDDEAPRIDIGHDKLVFSIDRYGCEAFVSLPEALLDDNCQKTEDIKVSVIHPGGNIDGNGGAALFGLGVSEVVYVAEDDCHNQSRDTLYIEVIDEGPPVAICLEYTVVSIDDTIVRVPAVDFDLGSYDACGPVKLEVRRMDATCNDDDAAFGDYVHFCCADAGKQVQVVLRVTDHDGNRNECMVAVDVQDKSPARVLCLPDITVRCGFNFGPPSTFGWIRPEHEQQSIDIHEDFLVSATGDLRDGVYFDDCGATVRELEPEDLRDQCGRGLYIRTLVVTDAAGIETTCRQEIRFVADEELDPLVWTFFPADANVEGCGDTEMLHPDFLGKPAVSERTCAQVGMTYEDTYYEKEPTSPHCLLVERTWSVIDWCYSGGRIVLQDIQYLKVNDTAPPVIAGECDMLRFNAGEECEPVLVRIENAAEDCIDEDRLRWTYRLSPAGGPLAEEREVIAGSSGKAVVEATLGIGAYELMWVVSDLCGNTASCVQVIEVVCDLPSESVLVGGDIHTRQGEPMDAVTVKLMDREGIDLIDETQSNEDGTYRFIPMETGNAYRVEALRNNDPLNGVTTLDILRLQRHVLGLDELSSVAELVAADINRDGRVTALDMVALRRTILGVTEGFTNNTSWRFFWKELLEGATDPGELAEGYDIARLETDMDIGFIGIKTGDLSGDAVGHRGSGPRAQGQIGLTYTYRERGSTTEVVVRAGEDLSLNALQGAWYWRGGDVRTVVPGMLNMTREELHVDERRGELSIAWTTPSQVDVQEGDVLFTVVIDVAVSMVDAMDWRPTGRIENIAIRGERISSIEMKRLDDRTTPLTVQQNAPNPWKDHTRIEYTLPGDGEVSLRIYDALYRLVHSESRGGRAGDGTFDLYVDDLPEPGVYLYEVRWQDEVVARQMIRLE